LHHPKRLEDAKQRLTSVLQLLTSVCQNSATRESLTTFQDKGFYFYLKSRISNYSVTLILDHLLRAKLDEFV